VRLSEKVCVQGLAADLQTRAFTQGTCGNDAVRKADSQDASKQGANIGIGREACACGQALPQTSPKLLQLQLHTAFSWRHTFS
jgi:hypothetical protein